MVGYLKTRRLARVLLIVAQASKAAYFAQLYALNEASDDEEEADDVLDTPGDSPRNGDRPPSSSFPSSQIQSTERRSPKSPRKPPAIHRTNSAPLPSVTTVQEKTNFTRKTSLLRYDTSTPPSESSFSGKTPSVIPSSTQGQRPNPERRVVSDPGGGSLVLKNSTGIANMLQKNQKRKREAPIKLVPEHQRIFTGLNFFYLPPDDKKHVRKLRINKARERGAIWAKELGDGVTHVIADEFLTHEEVMKYVNETLKIEALPKDAILVNEMYPVHCWTFNRILDKNQDKYTVKSGISELKEKPTSQTNPSTTEEYDDDVHGRTPPREDSPSQAVDAEGQAGRMESPHQASPPKNFQRVLGFDDALTEMIEFLQSKTGLEHLEDEDAESRPSSSSSMQDPGDSDDSRERSPSLVRKATKKKRKDPKGTFNQENFSCMTGGTGETGTNPNSRTIEVLQEMSDYYDGIKDQWRSRAYRQAIGTLKRQTHKITSAKEAFELPKIGERIAAKIEEIVLTDGLRRLEFAKGEPTYLVLQTFLKIYGVGLSQGWSWIQQGHKTLADLKTRAHLTETQKIGIEHYDDFNTRIPRDQVTALGEIVKKAVATIDPDVSATIGGSYRRGAANAGDIDFLISKPGTASTTYLISFVNDLVNVLTDSGFLVAALAVPRSETASKWHGACVLPGVSTWRRIDFLLVPESEMGAALIYFTGDDIFNRSMRLLAGRYHYRLNQRGLYKNVMRGPGREKLNEGELIEGADEKKIFAALGVPWRPPEQRLCH